MTRKLGFLFALTLTPFVTVAACDLEKDDGAGTLEEEVETKGDASESESESEGEDESESDSDPGTTSMGTTPTDPTDPEPPPEGDCNAPIPGLAGALSIRYGDIPPYEPGGGGGSGSDTGDSDGGPDPDSIVIELSNALNSCDDPSPLLACGGNWNVTIVLPPEMQVPGTYSLWEDLNAGFSFADQLHENPIDEEDCAWGGGSFDGTLEIISIDDNGIEGRLCGTDAWDFVADGTFSAPRCS